MTIIDVQLSKLTLSETNQARKKKHTEAFIAELAESIYSLGILQNLVVTKSKKKGFYEVVAGGGRLRALNMLLETGRLPEHLQTLSVRLVDDAVAFLASLTENAVRTNMHPADEFLAFQHLAEQGKSVEDIAAHFGVAPVVVSRRLKLARVAPSLLETYRQGDMSLECLMAFTIDDNHERQEAVWKSLSSWQHHPHHIRSLLTKETFETDHRFVKLIGLDAYKNAGGTIRQDLFAGENSDGLYLENTALVRTLTLDHLTEISERIQADENWSWAKVILDNSDEAGDFEQVCPTRKELTDEQELALEKLRTEQNELAHQVDELPMNSPLRPEIFQQLSQVKNEIDTIYKQLDTWTEQVKELTGVAISVNRDGHVEVTRGLATPQAKKQLNQMRGRDQSASNKVQRIHSEALTRQLSANMTGIISAELMQSPRSALAVLAAKLGDDLFGHGFSRDTYSVKISLSNQTEILHSAAPDFAESKAATEIERHKAHWFEQLPKDDNGNVTSLLPWTLNQDTATLLEFLAFCTASSLDGVQFHEDVSVLNAIAQPLGCDPSEWWQPTEASYLSRVSKARIVEVVTEVLGAEQAAPLLPMKKKDAAKQAETLLAGTKWLPRPLMITEP
ncbi:ParB/RepB/Spo0J family partition protein [Paenalcaligenes sp. Me131]|uniref:ParB/RepB/Spo0J family partition protein n=1 Tax=Paenalcaligenes sp. Me131 TaxID=3392636 RepID=UPI003D2D2A8E